MIDGQLVSLSWNKAPTWGLRQDFYYCKLRFCWYGAVSLTRGWVCRLQLLLALASAVILGSQSLGTRDHILLSQIRDFPFRRLVRLTGLRWRYSTPSPHGIVGFPDTPFSPDSSVFSSKFCSSVYCLPGVDNSPFFYLSPLRIIFHELNIIIQFL
jgi:hypothetical protein